MILKEEFLKLVYKAELRKIIDGDTIDFNVTFGLGFSCNARIRLKGIDAPEIFKVSKHSEEFANGRIAHYRVKQWFFPVAYCYYISAEHRDLYGRWLGEVWRNVGEKSLNDYLIENYYKSKYPDWYHQEPLSKK